MRQGAATDDEASVVLLWFALGICYTRFCDVWGGGHYG